jgi:hypothetical protein
MAGFMAAAILAMSAFSGSGSARRRSTTALSAMVPQVSSPAAK